MERRNYKRKQKRKRRRMLKWLCVGLAAVSLITGISLCSIEGRAVSQKSGAEPRIKIAVRTPAQEEAKNSKIMAKAHRKTGETQNPGAKNSDRNLLLVNPRNKLPEDFSPKLIRLKNGQAVDERAYPELQKMMDDARSKGLSPLICSSYRTEEQQRSLYRQQVENYMDRGYGKAAAEKEAGKWVAVPGTSEHQTGLALDIVSESYQLLDENQADTPEQKWLMENAHKYGFILRYPKEKTEITGIGYEPWHYRYVGKEAARQIYKKGICLEEYLD